MSGPYDQQLLGHGAGRVGGVSGGQLVGQTVGSTGAHFGGQSGAQFVGQSAGQFTSQSGGQSGAHFTGGQSGGQALGQTPVVRGDRARRQRNDSTSTASSSERVYKLAGGAAPVAVSGGYQQYSAEANYTSGVGGGVSYTAGGDYSAAAVSGQRRQGRVQRQVIRLPDQHQGQVRQVRRRLPTPEPDTLERVFVQRQGHEVIEEITEIPTTPPPRVQERTVVEPAGPPQVVRRVIRVPPRSGGGGYQLQQGSSFVSNQGFTGGNVLGAGSYGNVQQAYGGGYSSVGSGYASVGGGYGSVGGGYGSVGTGYGSVGTGYGSVGTGYGSFGGGYGSFGGGYQQQGYGYGGYGSQSVAPSGVISGATCFYV